MLFIVIFLIIGTGFSQDINSISNLIADDKLVEATEKLLQKSLLSPNDVSTKKLLAKVYLKRGLYEKAQQQINYLVTLSKSTDHLYLQAQAHQLKGEWKKCEQVCYQILARDRRYSPGLLLLAKVHEKNKHYDLADMSYKDVSLINPKDKDFLINYCFYLIKQNRLDEAKSPLRTLKKLFLENHQTFYVLAFYYFKQKKNDLALAHINKALFYKPFYQNYQRLLFDIYLQNKNYQAVINWLKSRENEGDEWTFFKLAYYQFIELNPDGFKIKPTHYSKILSHLKKSLEKNNQNEYVRFFMENFIINNTPFNHLDRVSIANYHQSRGNFLNEMGDYPMANYHYLRAVSITPESPSVREAYTRFLKQTKKWHDYREQLRIVDMLSTVDSNEDSLQTEGFLSAEGSFKLNAEIEIIDRKLASSLMEEKEIDIKDLTYYREKLAIFPEIKTEDKQVLYVRENMLKITGDFLKSSKNFELVPFSENRENGDQDYFITLNFKYTPYVLIDFQVYDASTKLSLTNGQLARKGQYALVNALSELKIFLEQFIPLKGKIIKKLNQHLIVDLGKMNNLTNGQELQIVNQFNFDETYSAKIKKIDDYISEIELLDEGDLPFIKLGELVFLGRQ